ncbi:MAG: 1,4-dihydroxy-6-naphthoate synthase [Bacteroidales bacterium]|nr:1,4-dihydroxy-6-naphthoate synthase [Bacteroidales bacterium]MDD3860457.1 1,4-dihydroxy-6-naphthoate synthase [Bacteroidales bacterium]
MKLSLAISSCPNDTFMFDALINNKIDVKNYNFDLIIADVEELNKLSQKAETDISKMSFHNFFKVEDKYQMLTSGAALGKNCGPLIISKRKIYPDELSDCRIAIPGESTTANLLMQIFFPQAINKQIYLFSDIEDLVLYNECDAGLVIHETRFTYQKRGLKLIADLGNLWEGKYRLPIPLGGIAIKRSLSEHVKTDINKIVRNSIEYAFANPSSAMDFMKNNAVELEDDILQKHVNLYVNDYSIDLGEDGRKSVEKLKEVHGEINQKDLSGEKLFVE